MIWCSGFVRDFAWIDLPVFAEDGDPVHDRGVVGSEPGLYFVGLFFLSAVSSSLVGGVGRDAEYIAKHIASRELKAGRGYARWPEHKAVRYQIGSGLEDQQPEPAAANRAGMTFTRYAGGFDGLPTELALREVILVLSRAVRDPDFLASYSGLSWGKREEQKTGTWPIVTMTRTTLARCRSSSGLHGQGPGSTTIPPGEPSVASWAPSWKIATSVPMMARCQVMPT